MRWFIGTVIAVVVAMGIYVSSAAVSLKNLAEAARAGDGAAVLARTDTDRLRRALVDQIVASYLKQLGRDKPVKPLQRMAANTYGASIADAMIAKLLNQDSLTAILNKGAISSNGAVVNMQRLTDIDTSDLLKNVMRITPTKPVEFSIRLGETTNDGGLSLHFEAGWKLSSVQLPPSAVQTLAQSLIDNGGRNG